MRNELSYRSYLIIGSGRLSRHLQHYFQLLAIPFETWNRSQDISLLQSKIEKKPTVLLAISDSSIVSFFETYLQNKNLKIIHFSGALHDSRIIACHPLMTFSHELYSLDIYKNVYFAVTGTSSLQNAIPELPNLSFELEEKDKAYYHAWCVLTAAGTQTLWKSALQNLRSIGVPEKAVENYIQKIAHNFLSNPENSLTGPWVRKDEITIHKNLQALSKSSAAKVYELLMKGQL